MKFPTMTNLLLGFSVVFGLAIAEPLIARQKNPDVNVADANSDGQVTTEELKAYLTGKYVEAWARKIDSNGNGKISKWEFRLLDKALEQVIKEQNESGTSSGPPAGKRPRSSLQSMNSSFLQRKPRVGSTVESLAVYNEQGKAVDFNEFRGKHVVIVFGCLT